MRLLRDHAGAFAQDVQLQTSAVKLAFTVSSATAITEAVFDAMMVQVSIMSKSSGEITVMPRMPLRHAFNKSSVKEGYFVWGTNILKGTIDLSRLGAVDLNEGEYFSINYEGFPANAVTNIMAIDAPVLAKAVEITEEIVISGTVKDIVVADKHSLFIPLTDGNGNGLHSLQLQYADRTVTYDEDELKVMNEAMNDLACVIDNQLDDADGTTRLVKFGYDQLLYLDITNVIRIKVTPKTKNPTSIYLERHQAV